MIVVPGYNIVTDDLLFNMDSFYPPSYGGSGTVLTDSVKGLTADFSDADREGWNIDNKPNGWSFDQTQNDTVVSPNSSDFEFQYNDSYSIEMWVNMRQQNSEYGYMINGRFTDASGVDYAGWGMMFDNGVLTGFVGGYPSNVLSWRRIETSSADWNTYVYNKWVQIVWSHDATLANCKLYVNGVDRTNARSDQTSPPYTVNYDSNFKMGFARDTFNWAFRLPMNGTISATRIYNKTLSSAEVNRNFNARRNYYGI